MWMNEFRDKYNFRGPIIPFYKVLIWFLSSTTVVIVSRPLPLTALDPGGNKQLLLDMAKTHY